MGIVAKARVCAGQLLPGKRSMRFPLSILWVLSAALVFAAASPRQCAGQAAQQAAPTSTTAAQQAGGTKAPTQDAYTLPPDKLAKAEALSRIRLVLGIAGTLWYFVFFWLLLATRTVARLGYWAQRVTARRWLEGLLFFGVLLVAFTLAGLPLDVYGHSVSLRYGISVQGWWSWLGDAAKGLGLSLAIGAPVLLLFNWVVFRWPRRYWLVGWAVAVPLMVLGAFVSPLLDPVFNKFEPLQKSDPALVAQLEKVVARTGTEIPADRMYLMKASVKTNGLNAYVTGVGATKRVVVWDTTAGRIPNDEILFIFAHESGHYVLHHIPIGLTASAAFTFLLFWVCARVARWVVRRWGPRWEVFAIPSRPGFVVLLLTLSVASFVTQPISNGFSRYIEHQADVYGQEAIHGIVPDPQRTAVAAFNALGAAWLEDPHPNGFLVFWAYSHPSIQSRARFAAQYDPWANGGHGEFFKR